MDCLILQFNSSMRCSGLFYVRTMDTLSLIFSIWLEGPINVLDYVLNIAGLRPNKYARL